MAKQILMGSFEVPGWGGASTSSYSLLEKMQNLGYDVSLVNLIAQNDVDLFRYYYGDKIGNPKNLPNVHNCFLKHPFHDKPPDLKSIIHQVKPDIIVAVGWLAAHILKSNVPDIRLIFLTAGCDQIAILIKEKEIYDLVSLLDHINGYKYNLGIASVRERQAVDIADLIITHSDSNLILHKFFFHNRTGKIFPEIIWFAEWIYEDALNHTSHAKPFSQREIDVMFIASNWNRVLKNYSMVKKIVNDLENINIHIIGQVDERQSNVVYHELVTDREHLFKLLGNTKSVVSTSLFDAAPGILFESSAMGCNIVASKNCGNWMLCNENLLVDPYTLDNYIEKIKKSVTKKYNDNIDYFTDLKSFDKLTEIIDLI